MTDSWQPPDVDDLDESIPPPPIGRRRGNLIGWLADLQAGHERRVAEAHDGGEGRPVQIDDVVAGVIAVVDVVLIFGALLGLWAIVGAWFALVVAIAGAVWLLYMLFTGRDGPGGMSDPVRWR